MRRSTQQGCQQTCKRSLTTIDSISSNLGPGLSYTTWRAHVPLYPLFLLYLFVAFWGGGIFFYKFSSTQRKPWQSEKETRSHDLFLGYQRRRSMGTDDGCKTSPASLFTISQRRSQGLRAHRTDSHNIFPVKTESHIFFVWMNMTIFFIFVFIWAAFAGSEGGGMVVGCHHVWLSGVAQPQAEWDV